MLSNWLFSQLVLLSLNWLLDWLVLLALDWLLVSFGAPWSLLMLKIFLACIRLWWKIDKTDNMIRMFFFKNVSKIFDVYSVGCLPGLLITSLEYWFE